MIVRTEKVYVDWLDIYRSGCGTRITVDVWEENVNRPGEILLVRRHVHVLHYNLCGYQSFRKVIKATIQECHDVLTKTNKKFYGYY